MATEHVVLIASAALTTASGLLLFASTSDAAMSLASRPWAPSLLLPLGLTMSTEEDTKPSTRIPSPPHRTKRVLAMSSFTVVAAFGALAGAHHRPHGADGSRDLPGLRTRDRLCLTGDGKAPSDCSAESHLGRAQRTPVL
ncbi:hypothetical protein [Pendulispora albinea]|uniref:Uncharacterized protein n=1 Tax=Pendulispora albinea TaxID=2741071 RepID=A0ABZ2LSH4_9BACT